MMIWAQAETGQITGTVLDSTGAAIPKADIAAKNVATGATRTTVSGGSGDYLIPSLPPGSYEVTISAAGFTATKTKIQVTVGAKIGNDVTLKVGSSATTVEVAESAVRVNIETQSLTNIINAEQVTEMPSLTRNPYDFVSSMPNVSPADPGGRGVGYAINGLRSAGTNVLLDGVANNNEFTGTVGQPVPLDSVQEYSVTTSSFTAEVGRADAGVVNVLTKSGSNAFHGTLYEFNRVSSLASNGFYNNANGLPKGIYDRNNFGYSLGGPAIKNKLFFFQNTEWTRVRSGANQVAFIPTSQFIAAAAPATQAYFAQYGALRSDLNTLATYTKAQLVGLKFNPCTTTLTDACNTLPSSTPMFSKVNYTAPADAGGGLPQNTYNLVGRVDYNLSQGTQMYVRYALYNESDFAGTVNTSPYKGYETGQTNVNNSISVSFTHSFSPNFVSQTKISYNRLNNQQPLGTNVASPTLYMNSAATTAILGTNIALPGYNEYTPGSSIPFGGPQNFASLNQDLSKVWGKHEFRFGGQYTYFQDNRVFGAYEEAVQALGTTVGKSINNFLLGQVNSFVAAVDPQGKFPGQTLTLPVGQPSFTRSNRYKEGALYAQDAWKLSRSFTVNLGLRWEYYGTQHNKNSALDSNYYLGSGSTIFDQIRNGQVYTVPNSPNGQLWAASPTNFAPRVGFAWDVTGDGKTSLRGGYGIAYERNFGNVTFNIIQNPPNYAVITLTAGTDLPTIPIAISNAGPLAGNVGTKTLGNVTLRAVDPNIKQAYAHTYSLTLEHQFGGNVLASLGYSGSRGVDLYSIYNYNPIGSGNNYEGDPCTPGTDGNPGNCTSRLRQTQYGSINWRSNGGMSHYNAGIARVIMKNFARTGVTMDANYTWSHAIDNGSSTFSDGTHGSYVLGYLNPFAPNLDNGNSDFDIHNRVAISGIWHIPGFKGHTLTDKVLGGWEVSPIFTAHTGSPFTIYDCTNGYNFCPRATINGVAPTSGQTNVASGTPDNFVYYNFAQLNINNWYNPKTGISDFGPFPSNMLARNSVFGPGSWNMDLGIYKNTQINERFKLQFRLEMYNVFNHANFFVNTVDADVSNGPTAFVDGFRGGSRNIQLGAKVVF